ncbi:MAG: hypothetical protein ACR2HY_00895 [Acidimicrobiales bacterium]
MTPPESNVERLLDVAVYAPVGLVMAVLENAPEWVEAGRRRVGPQLASARVLGRLAVGEGSRQAGQALRQAAHQAEGFLARLGLAPSDTPVADNDDRPPPSEQHAPSTATVAEDSPARSARAGNGSAADAADLPIPGYDTLSASQVVQRLPGLPPEGLEAVRAYEQAGRARKTVLLRLAQLQETR